MRCVFGPVPSRRLGKSLGIDPVPLKTCDFNCVYCQLGRTRPLVVDRRAYVPTEKVLAEIENTLESREPGSIDWLTFQRHIEGLAAFRREYEGRLWLEVMLVGGINDSEEALLELAEALRSIQPDEVQINVPTRPPAEPWVADAIRHGIGLTRRLGALTPKRKRSHQAPEKWRSLHPGCPRRHP